MIAVGVSPVDDNFGSMGVSQGSVLSPFLFNLYMNELDTYVDTLKRSADKAYDKVKMESTPASKKYKAILYKFSAKKAGDLILEYGSVKEVRSAFKEAKEEHLEAYGRARGIDLDARHIQYVRYADDFLMGIVGPREFALEVRSKVDLFIKSNLHLEVRKNDLINRNEGGITFLGFLIYLVKFNKKTRTKWNHLQSIAKYKCRVHARLRLSDARLANASVYAIKGSLLKSFRSQMENLKLKWSVESRDTVSDGLIREWLGAELTQENKNGTLRTVSGRNEALRRWESHFKELFSKEGGLALKFFKENILSLDILENSNVDATNRIVAARDRFLNDLTQIEDDLNDPWLEERREKAAARYKKKSNDPNSPWSTLDESDVLKNAEMLANEALSQERVRRIGIAAPMGDVIQKLKDRGFFHGTQDRPTGCQQLLLLNDAEIIIFYSVLIRGLINWYRCADNFSSVKGIDAILRKSCLFTLARKHNKSKAWAYSTFGDDVVLKLPHGPAVSLPTRAYIGSLPSKFLVKDPDLAGFNLDQLLNRYQFRLTQGRKYFQQCAVNDCPNTDIEVHHMKRLFRKTSGDRGTSILNDKGRRVTGTSTVLSAMNRQQLPLCRDHHLDFEKGVYHELDTTYLKGAFSTKVLDSVVAEQLFKGGEARLLKEPRSKDTE
jgi:hypothetical protein